MEAGSVTRYVKRCARNDDGEHAAVAAVSDAISTHAGIRRTFADAGRREFGVGAEYSLVVGIRRACDPGGQQREYQTSSNQTKHDRRIVSEQQGARNHAGPAPVARNLADCGPVADCLKPDESETVTLPSLQGGDQRTSHAPLGDAAPSDHRHQRGLDATQMRELGLDVDELHLG